MDEIQIEVLTKGVDVALLAQMVSDFCLDEGISVNVHYTKEKVDE